MYIRPIIIASAMLGAVLTACGGGNDPLLNPPAPTNPAPKPTPQIATNFANGIDGWKGGYSDYTIDTEPTDVVWESRIVPYPLTGSAYYTGGTNRSDDLFIYNKKKFTGYKPSTAYKLAFEMEIVTNQSSGCVGVGGAPGESVYVIAGATPLEPKTVKSGDEFVLNAERGNQATPGKQSQVLGNVANGVKDCGPQEYQVKTLKSAAPLAVQSDANGEFWVFFGIDSGFEAKSTVYYRSFKASVTQ